MLTALLLGIGLAWATPAELLAGAADAPGLSLVAAAETPARSQAPATPPVLHHGGHARGRVVTRPERFDAVVEGAPRIVPLRGLAGLEDALERPGPRPSASCLSQRGPPSRS